MSFVTKTTQNPDKSWTATGGSSLVALSVTRVRKQDAESQLEDWINAKDEMAALRRQLAAAAEQIEELQDAGRRMAACGEDLLERLVNVTEGDDDSVSNEEISEIKATFGIAGEDD